MLPGNYRGAFLRVGDQQCEARVSVQRFEIRIFIEVQVHRGPQPVIHGFT